MTRAVMRQVRRRVRLVQNVRMGTWVSNRRCAQEEEDRARADGLLFGGEEDGLVVLVHLLHCVQDDARVGELLQTAVMLEQRVSAASLFAVPVPK